MRARKWRSPRTIDAPSMLDSRCFHFPPINDIMKLFYASTLFTLLCLSEAAALPPMTFRGDLVTNRYDTGEPWTTLVDGTEFQPAAGNLSPLAQAHLRRLTTNPMSTDAASFKKIYVDGAETYFDDYAQAWRALGWYIDCDYCDTDEDGEKYCWWDLGDDEEVGKRYQGCKRFLLWAAYVDENYSGGGVGEYKYYDRKSDKWDASTCEYEKSSRCVPMDCHLPNTHFTLLGIFKEPDYDQWMEQLFKHQGDCLWDDDEYNLMQGDRRAWPTGCTSTPFTADDGKTISYDLKPGANGEMGIGMYTDEACITEYQGSLRIEEVLHTMVCDGYVDDDDYMDGGEGDDAITSWMCNNNNTDYLAWYQKYLKNNDYDRGDAGDEGRSNIWSLDHYLKTWNAAFDVYKQCQPCKAYDLTHTVAGIGYVKNNEGDRYQYDRKYDECAEELNDDRAIREYMENDVFHCHDDAGYDNVNQCMKFAYKTNMLTASWREVEMASMQGTIVDLQIKGMSSFQVLGQQLSYPSRQDLVQGWAALIVSAVLFAISVCRYKTIKDGTQRSAMREPLSPNSTSSSDDSNDSPPRRQTSKSTAAVITTNTKKAARKVRTWLQKPHWAKAYIITGTHRGSSKRSRNQSGGDGKEEVEGVPSDEEQLSSPTSVQEEISDPKPRSKRPFRKNCPSRTHRTRRQGRFFEDAYC